jgi:D-alanyl-D-alanine-carboxypeptidase/D-alanyl-D-alanine-endopeptidase
MTRVMITRWFTTLALGLASTASANELPDKELVAHIQEEMRQGKYVGVIIGLVDGDQTIVQSFGETAKGSGRAPNEHTLFEISSISKTFVATILADLAVRTDLELTDPVSYYLPNDVRLAAIGERQITLEDLAVHTAGLPYTPEDFQPPEGINPFSRYTTADLWSSVNAFTPTRPSGDVHDYSAFGYGILTHALSFPTGHSFGELLRIHITEPLGMKDTVLKPSPDQQRFLATGYDPEGGVAPYMDWGALQGAGSIFSTLADMLFYIEANMGRLDTPLYEAMKLTHPVRDRDELIGLAWHRTEGFADRSHYGTANGYRAFVGFLMDGSRGVVVLANTKHGVIELGNRLLLGADHVDLTSED